MKALRNSLLFAGLAQAGSVSAATITTGFTWVAGNSIPDNDSSGLVRTGTVLMNVASIDLITVTLETSGGWNGDLYAYLHHSSGFSVLVNRPGVTAANPAGSAGSGINAVFADAAPADVHNAPGSITGTWQPDGRNLDPSFVLDTTPRTTMLSGFNGLDPNGTWTLFIADLAAGDEATLISWGVTITGEIIPEPATAAMVTFTAAAGLLRRSRRRIS